MFGISDSKVREKLLREPELNLPKTLDICRAAEMSQAQIKAVSDLNSANVHLVKEKEGKKPTSAPARQQRYPFCFCGWKYDGKREACPAWGKKCNRCGKENHFAKKCGFNSGSKQTVNCIL